MVDLPNNEINVVIYEPIVSRKEDNPKERIMGPVYLFSMGSGEDYLHKNDKFDQFQMRKNINKAISHQI